MKTGLDQPHIDMSEPHKKAIITGATAVFMKELCKDMMKLHMLTGDSDMAQIAQACAARILQSQKCAELETIVEAVIQHPDGMPDIKNTALLEEILHRYAETAGAERNGTAREFRQNTLIPDIVQSASMQSVVSEVEANRFINLINEQQAFEPQTSFQHIVFNAINTLPQQIEWT